MTKSLAANDGVVNVKLTSRRELITAKLARGQRRDYVVELLVLMMFQVHSEDGSSLPLDLELRFSFYPSSLHTLFVLCNCWNVLS